MYLVKTPEFLISSFRSIRWRIPDSKAIYLTFDDGPNPDSTPALLQVLDDYNISASFFCLGTHAKKYPELIALIKERGHVLGTHGFEHISGWKTSVEDYLENISKASKYIGSKLFRPPYGKITPRQYSTLKMQYKIVMWDIMPGDFDPNISAEDCVKNIVNNLKDGSIIVLHDQVEIQEKTIRIIKKLHKRVNRDFRSLPVK